MTPGTRASGRVDALVSWLSTGLRSGAAMPAVDAFAATRGSASIEWARSGAMALTGLADGAPRLAPGPLASVARWAVEALRALAPAARHAALEAVDGAALLGERAALFGLRRRGAISPGGSCRLLPAVDGWIAVNLARADDVSLLPAWLGEGDVSDPWAFVALRMRERGARDAIERARLVGLPATVAEDPPVETPPWLRVAAMGEARARHEDASPLVVDLSSLWAGPLATHLLALAGARVIKVESTRRPDGARSGPGAFFDLLNAGKRSVALDFGTPEGRAALRALVERADIVVESSRPRALAQLGIEAEALVRARPGLTWVAISGYGRAEPGAGWVAFGDDAGVAAGLSRALAQRHGAPLFCADAIADPLTGVHAALAAYASWCGGGGHLLDLALRDVAANALLRAASPGDTAGEDDRVVETAGGWELCVGGERIAVAPPRARVAAGRARPLGADTREVCEELGIPC